ncbi:MAG: hypothetical protein SGARI_000261, partial [Bacillariaceae sp.]
LGKTNLTTEEREWLAPNDFDGGKEIISLKIPNQIFLYDQTELKSDYLWTGLASYLRVSKIPEQQYKGAKGKNLQHLSLCDPKYDAFRAKLMPYSYELSVWLQKYLLPLARDPSREDVVVANVDRIAEIFETYKTDPCGRLVVQIDETRMLDGRSTRPNITYLTPKTLYIDTLFRNYSIIMKTRGYEINFPKGRPESSSNRDSGAADPAKACRGGGENMRNYSHSQRSHAHYHYDSQPREARYDSSMDQYRHGEHQQRESRQSQARLYDPYASMERYEPRSSQPRNYDPYDSLDRYGPAYYEDSEPQGYRRYDPMERYGPAFYEDFEPQGYRRYDPMERYGPAYYEDFEQGKKRRYDSMERYAPAYYEDFGQRQNFRYNSIERYGPASGEGFGQEHPRREDPVESYHPREEKLDREYYRRPDSMERYHRREEEFEREDYRQQDSWGHHPCSDDAWETGKSHRDDSWGRANGATEPGEYRNE